MTGRVWDDTGRVCRETGKDWVGCRSTGGSWGGIKGKQYEGLQRRGSTVGGNGTSKKELGMEMRTTGRN